jgi:hypothetical protein
MTPRVVTRRVEAPTVAWIVEVGEDKFICQSEQEARELADDLRADLASQYVRLEP